MPSGAPIKKGIQPMPRIYTSQNVPLDFCQGHFPSEKEALEQYGKLGDGPDGRGNCFEYDTEHPPYEEEGTCCETCGRDITQADLEAIPFPRRAFIAGKIGR